MSRSRDVRDNESFREYLREVYGDNMRKFFRDFEGNGPVNANALFRFYSAQQHIAVLLPELIVALKRR